MAASHRQPAVPAPPPLDAAELALVAALARLAARRQRAAEQQPAQAT